MHKLKIRKLVQETFPDEDMVLFYLIALFWGQVIKLTHVRPMLLFYTRWKRQEIYGFMAFSGSIEMEPFP